MDIIKWSIIFLVLLMTIPIIGSETLEVIEQWDHGERILGSLQEYTVDNDGWLIGGFAGKGNKLIITPDRAFLYAPYGQGPSDLLDLRSIFPYHSDIAVVEKYGKVKIFTKKEGTYVWKATKWFKTSMDTHTIQDGVFFDNKWFFAGEGDIYTENKLSLEEKIKVFCLKVYDDNGKVLKVLVPGESIKSSMHRLMKYFVDVSNGEVVYMKENELNVKIIDPVKLTLEQEIHLEKPAFYKKMPDDFYVLTPRIKGRFDLMDKAYEKWKTAYSSIVKMVVVDDFLVVQLRTCNEKLKKFALLLYESKTYNLKKTIYTDDILMASQNGKYYFFAEGDPKFDEADRILIKVCRVKETDEK